MSGWTWRSDGTARAPHTSLMLHGREVGWLEFTRPIPFPSLFADSVVKALNELDAMHQQDEDDRRREADRDNAEVIE